MTCCKLPCTHTKTYTLLDPWASTTPWVPELEGQDHSPMVGDACALNACAKPLRQDEECYAVTQIDGWVCWRHVRPNEGPIRSGPMPENPGADPPRPPK